MNIDNSPQRSYTQEIILEFKGDNYVIASGDSARINEEKVSFVPGCVDIAKKIVSSQDLQRSFLSFHM